MKKKIFVSVLLVVALLLAAGCGKEEIVDADPVINNDQTTAANPVDTFMMLSDLSAAFGHEAANFGDNDIQDYNPKAYSMICGDYMIAEVKYAKDSDDSSEMFVRTANTTDGNISGVQGNLSFKDYDSNGITVKYALVENDTYVAYWVHGEYSYSLYETEEIEETYLKVLIDYLTASMPDSDFETNEE